MAESTSGNGNKGTKRLSQEAAEGEADPKRGKPQGHQVNQDFVSLDGAPTALSFEEREAEYLRRNYALIHAGSDTFQGRLNYWTNQQNEDGHNAEDNYHRLTADKDDEFNTMLYEDCVLAVDCVTEAIKDEEGQPAYALFTHGLYDVTAEPYTQGPTTIVARNEKELILAWMLNAYRHTDFSGKPDRQKEDAEASMHIICINAVHVSEQEDYIYVFDSFPGLEEKGKAIFNKKELQDCLTATAWLKGKKLTYVERNDRNKALAAHQLRGSTRKSCGIHSILNGWAVAMGIRDWLDPTVALREADYVDAIYLIKLVVCGLCDFWTIFAFMRHIRLIILPEEVKKYAQYHNMIYKSGVDKDKPAIKTMGTSAIDRLVSTMKTEGVHFFDRTVGMTGDISNKNKKIRQNGEASLEKRRLAALDISHTFADDDSSERIVREKKLHEELEANFERAKAALDAQAPSTNTASNTDAAPILPTANESAPTLPGLKEKIQERIRVVIEKHQRSRPDSKPQDKGVHTPPDTNANASINEAINTNTENNDPYAQANQQLTQALGRCHNLAFLVKDQLNPSSFRPRRDCRVKTFNHLAQEVLGTDNFIPVPLIMKAVVEVVAEEFGATLYKDDALGGKVDRMREWRFPEVGLDYNGLSVGEDGVGA
ncbi:hypothetical protein Vi05172_g11629 [Venturia inaequalis]|nr:hypothetical protein Vi05172_g11629 [Venturia inaequalis]